MNLIRQKEPSTASHVYWVEFFVYPYDLVVKWLLVSVDKHAESLTNKFTLLIQITF